MRFPWALKFKRWVLPMEELFYCIISHGISMWLTRSYMDAITALFDLPMPNCLVIMLPLLYVASSLDQDFLGLSRKCLFLPCMPVCHPGPGYYPTFSKSVALARICYIATHLLVPTTRAHDVDFKDLKHEEHNLISAAGLFPSILKDSKPSIFDFLNNSLPHSDLEGPFFQSTVGPLFLWRTISLLASWTIVPPLPFASIFLWRTIDLFQMKAGYLTLEGQLALFGLTVSPLSLWKTAVFLFLQPTIDPPLPAKDNWPLSFLIDH